ncbi:MAG: hypothetical protein ACI8TP_002780 [Acidimicrobiales bacterium]|jgi:hypothetical protein
MIESIRSAVLLGLGCLASDEIMGGFGRGPGRTLRMVLWHWSAAVIMCRRRLVVASQCQLTGRKGH